MQKLASIINIFQTNELYTHTHEEIVRQDRKVYLTNKLLTIVLQFLQYSS